MFAAILGESRTRSLPLLNPWQVIPLHDFSLPNLRFSNLLTYISCDTSLIIFFFLPIPIISDQIIYLTGLSFDSKKREMNSNNWLAFPLSPTHSSLPPHIHSSQNSHFNLGLVNDNIDNPFQNQGMCTHIYVYVCSYSRP